MGHLLGCLFGCLVSTPPHRPDRHRRRSEHLSAAGEIPTTLLLVLWSWSVGRFGFAPAACRWVLGAPPGRGGGSGRVTRVCQWAASGRVSGRRHGMRQWVLGGEAPEHRHRLVQQQELRGGEMAGGRGWSGGRPTSPAVKVGGQPRRSASAAPTGPRAEPPTARFRPGSGKSPGQMAWQPLTGNPDNPSFLPCPSCAVECGCGGWGWGRSEGSTAAPEPLGSPSTGRAASRRGRGAARGEQSGRAAGEREGQGSGRGPGGGRPEGVGQVGGLSERVDQQAARRRPRRARGVEGGHRRPAPADRPPRGCVGRNRFWSNFCGVTTPCDR